MSRSKKYLEAVEDAEQQPQPKGLLRSIRVRNLLSFGPDTEELELRQLNVLIGPNGSGKSNLIAALSLLPYMAGNLNEGFKAGNSTLKEWLNKDDPKRVAEVEYAVNESAKNYFTHRLRFTTEREWFFDLLEEEIRSHIPTKTLAESAAFPPLAVYHSRFEKTRFGRGGSMISTAGRDADLSFITPEASVLAQLRDRNRFPELAFLTTAYEGIGFFRNWVFGGDSPLREPQRGDSPGNFPREGGANLVLVLNQLRRELDAKDQIIALLDELYDGIKDYETFTQAAYVEFFLKERKHLFSAPRLSDGTLRFLYLLAILCHPNPPPVICLEEPELGLHPDAVIAIGRLIKEASERTQLIITTHSDIILDCVSPDDVIVCEKHDGQTEMNRLNKEELKHWLEKYSVSQLWTRNHIGGNRW